MWMTQKYYQKNVWYKHLNQLMLSTSYLPPTYSVSFIATFPALALSTNEQCSCGCQSYEITTLASRHRAILRLKKEYSNLSILCQPRCECNTRLPSLTCSASRLSDGLKGESTSWMMLNGHLPHHEFSGQGSQSNWSRIWLMVGTMPSDVCTASVPEMKSFWTSITKSASSDRKQNECRPGA